ncbi:hypothetical protein KCU65_g287, partial [Aureobasidium melanogenum]
MCPIIRRRNQCPRLRNRHRRNIRPESRNIIRTLSLPYPLHPSKVPRAQCHQDRIQFLVNAEIVNVIAFSAAFAAFERQAFCERPCSRQRPIPAADADSRIFERRTSLMVDVDAQYCPLSSQEQLFLALRRNQRVVPWRPEEISTRVSKELPDQRPEKTYPRLLLLLANIFLRILSTLRRNMIRLHSKPLLIHLANINTHRSKNQESLFAPCPKEMCKWVVRYERKWKGSIRLWISATASFVRASACSGSARFSEGSRDLGDQSSWPGCTSRLKKVMDECSKQMLNSSTYYTLRDGSGCKQVKTGSRLHRIMWFQIKVHSIILSTYCSKGYQSTSTTAKRPYNKRKEGEGCISKPLLRQSGEKAVKKRPC